MVTCPYCDEQAIKRLAKLRLKPGGISTAVKCAACRRRVGATRWSWLALLPLVLPLFEIGHLPLSWVLMLMFGGIVFYAFAQMYLLPLSRRH